MSVQTENGQVVVKDLPSAEICVAVSSLRMLIFDGRHKLNPNRKFRRSSQKNNDV